MVIAVAVAVLIAVIAGLLYADVRGDLRSVETDLEEAQARLDDTEAELTTTENELGETRTDPRERNRQFNLTSRCLVQMFGAWYNTTRLGYAATGFALQVAVNSRLCQIPRAAYERTT